MKKKHLEKHSICFNTMKIPTKIVSLDQLSPEKKILIDSLVDPLFVIMNANSLLKNKLENFVDAKTRQNFYAIDRAEQKLVESINLLRSQESAQN